jgi:sugar lactone lactonase YvrE
MQHLLLLILVLTLSFKSYSQSFNSPESVEYDPINNRYIVSNTNDGNLQSIIPGQAPILFTDAVSAPYGLAEYNGVIYVCDNGRVKGYSLTNAQEVFNINLSATFLNGICADGHGKLYVSDFSAKKIYAINIVTQTFGPVIENTVSTPNGILFDENRGRLIFCTWGTSAKLIEVDTTSFTMQTKITTSLSNIDGVVMDRCGNFLISEWGTDKIHKIDSNFSAPTVVFSAGINNPADLYFNVSNDTLAVPNTANNTVLFLDANFCPVIVDTTDTIDYTSIIEYQDIRLEVVTLSESIQLLWNASGISSAFISISDLSGKIVERIKVSTALSSSNTRSISTQKWVPGIYIISFSSGSQSAVKKVFINR